MTAEPTLRRAVAADAEKLALLGPATFLTAFAEDHPGDAILAHVRAYHSPAYYHAALADPTMALWLVETALGAPIGYAMLGRPTIDFPAAERDRELKRLYMLSGWQSGGWGARMLAAVEAEARASGGDRLLLCVYRQNIKAQVFYARQGFVDTGAVQRFMVGDAPFEDHIYAKAL
ncbi:GNAT superfamily N-acetyltransferase [Sphingomonas vulcanisoli]|uniref:GNAT superfamily N-acetyltransferase n=1 Tax=Sphingomonas vulcanisoli TaxID=1658060 RepID=A0ABX0TX48_9SPHN|nr:GNAT family N-acetyltransferase [Sphingomonas vulcanisoli]NIJ09012.1 GNAT superfamily N-acetyltransferase [Sphingomonas vulcanisoli]